MLTTLDSPMPSLLRDGTAQRTWQRCARIGGSGVGLCVENLSFLFVSIPEIGSRVMTIPALMLINPPKQYNKLGARQVRRHALCFSYLALLNIHRKVRNVC